MNFICSILDVFIIPLSYLFIIPLSLGIAYDSLKSKDESKREKFFIFGLLAWFVGGLSYGESPVSFCS